MTKRLIALSAALLFTAAADAATRPENAKYNGNCAWTLANESKMVQTDCKIHWMNPSTNETLCFSNAEHKEDFVKNPEKNVKMADAHFTAGGGSGTTRRTGEGSGQGAGHGTTQGSTHP